MAGPRDLPWAIFGDSNNFLKKKNMGVVISVLKESAYQDCMNHCHQDCMNHCQMIELRIFGRKLTYSKYEGCQI